MDIIQVQCEYYCLECAYFGLICSFLFHVLNFYLVVAVKLYQGIGNIVLL